MLLFDLITVHMLVRKKDCSEINTKNVVGAGIWRELICFTVVCFAFLFEAVLYKEESKNTLKASYCLFFSLA